jgi:hypothetical protein
VLDIDLSELLPAYLAARAAAGSSSAANVFDGELSLQLDFSHTSRKKPPEDTEGNWEVLLFFPFSFPPFSHVDYSSYTTCLSVYIFLLK